ncbi:MAG: hypothetical protein ABW185_11935 [Sedimenticola sp.]
MTSPETSDGEGRVTAPYVWESSRMRDRKSRLDEEWESRLSSHAKGQKASVRRGEIPLPSSPPKETPAWAISSRYK